MIVTWITPHAPGPNKVTYWSEKFKKKHKVEGKIGRYTYYDFTSGIIHHANISNFEVKVKETEIFKDIIVVLYWSYCFFVLFMFRHAWFVAI